MNHLTIIRPVERMDASEWIRLRYLLWPDSGSDRDVESYFDAGSHQSGQVMVAERDGGRLCGFVEISSRRDYVEGSTTSPVAYMEGWFVEASSRRQGVGKALLAAAELWARASGFTEFASDTIITNEDSIALHLSCGFAEVERTVHFIKPLSP